MADNPRVAGHVSNGVVITGNEGASLKTFVQDPVKAVGLVDITRNGIRDLFRGISAEMMVLTGHRSKTTHLPEQPFHHRLAFTYVTWQELSGFFRQVLQDCTGFKHGNVFTPICRIMIDDGGHAVIWREGEKFRFELVTCTDIDRHNLVIQAGFFKEQGDFMAVGCRPIIQINHEPKAPSKLS